MPEEINRMVTDAITNWFFTTSEAANANLMGQVTLTWDDEQTDRTELTADEVAFTLPEFAALPIVQAREFLTSLTLPPNDSAAAMLRAVISEISCSADLPPKRRATRSFFFIRFF